tara:strand:- start:2200 stop:3291 length:1092 start_codon:yes stop_codon:yes gene_type:complete
MNKSNNYAVIMAGGIGSRFWPMSKSSFPKQFIDILGTGESLIQQTYNRLSKICPVENILVVTNSKYKKLCRDQLPLLKSTNLLCEPVMRNTAACIAYSVFKIYAKNPDANILVTPSDHLITNQIEFNRIMKSALKVTQIEEVLVTVGIKPTRPDTGYGYIQFENKSLGLNTDFMKVKTFTEKPNQDLALQFIDSGEFLWNSGIFIWNAKTIIKSFRKYLRDMYDVFHDGIKYFNTKQEREFIEHVFPGCKNISIDYGIMEKSENVYVIPADFGWSDLGTWSSLYQHLQHDNNRNAVHGSKVILYDSTDNIVNIPNDKLVVMQGMNGYIVVESSGVLLICKKEDEQKIKQFVSDVKIKIGEKYV